LIIEKSRTYFLYKKLIEIEISVSSQLNSKIGQHAKARALCVILETSLFKMRNLFFIALISWSFWSCNSRKEVAYKKFEDSKTKFKIQEGFRLPALSEDELTFTENQAFQEFSKELKKYSSKSVLHDTCVAMQTSRKTKFHKKRYCFFLGHLSTIIEQDAIKADWKDKNNKSVYFQYQTQIGYYQNGKIEYYVNWLSGNKLNSDFEIGTKYFYTEEGKLADSLDLGNHFQADFKNVYKKLYELEHPYNFENIYYIDRIFDDKNAMWVISYHNQKSSIVIDDKTLKVYYINDFEKEITSLYKNFDFKYLYNRDDKTLIQF